MDPYIGQICLFPYLFSPTGWLPCDGRMMTIAANQALYALLGVSYGGDGKTTFALPNFNNANIGIPPACKYFISIQGLWPSRP
jgi:microcystin-dependent protein